MLGIIVSKEPHMPSLFYEPTFKQRLKLFQRMLHLFLADKLNLSYNEYISVKVKIKQKSLISQWPTFKNN